MSQRNKRPKFYNESLILRWILRLIRDESGGMNPSKIATILGLSRPHVQYYLRRAVENGLLKHAIKDAIAIYQITQLGKNFLDRYDNPMSKAPLCRAENIRFKAEVLYMPSTIPIDWRKIELRNWAQYTAQVDHIHIRYNDGKNPTIDFLPSPVEGEDPWKLYGMLVYECIKAALELHSRFGIKVGVLELSSRGEWLVYDPIAKTFTKYLGQVTYDGLAKVNASKPRSIGEFEFFDPRALHDYLAMPNRIQKIEQMLAQLVQSGSVPSLGDEHRYEHYR